METHGNSNAEEPSSGEVNDSVEEIVRKSIEHVLSIYPLISNSMLQVGIGTSVKPGIWKPIFYRMIDEGRIIQEQQSYKSPTGRASTYNLVRLNPERYPGVPRLLDAKLVAAQ